MAGDTNQEKDNEKLNDAVEQTETKDTGTKEEKQQSTVSSTVATGAESADAVDEANRAMEENPSGAGTEEEAVSSGGAVQEEDTESSSDSDAAQSNIVDSVASSGESGDEALGSGGSDSGAGAQAVGGGDASGSEGGLDAEGNEAQGQAVQTSSAPSASSDSEGSQGGDELDSETTEESFAVDVQDTSEETTTQVEDDFDSETTSETFQIKVEGENDAPEVGQDLAYIMDEDGTITFTQEQLLGYASDVDGDDLAAFNVQVGANASVVDNGDGTYTVTPEADFNGELDLTFDISDGQETISSSIDLTVRPINDAPVPEDKTFEVEEDGTLIFTDADLLAGATDIEGDNLTVEGVSYDGGDGILTDNGNGTYTFAPNENFNGDVNFSFDVSDGTDTVSANIDVSVTPVDDAPVSGNLAYSVDEDGSIRLSQEQLLSQASDVEGDALTASNLSVDGNATVTQNDDGSFTITPDADFNGDIDISFDISDGTNTVQATADLTVNPINDLPVPQDQQFSVEEDGTLIFTDADLLSGATDIEGDNLTVEGVSYDGGDGILTDNGNGTYTFAPNENFNGDVNFSFDVSDGTDTVSANIDVNVTPVDDAPVSGNLAYSVDEDGSIRLSQEQLLSQASDVEGDALTASNLSVDGNATVTQNDDGSFTITPDADFNGDIDISFDISDGTNTVQATADLTVNPINDLPVPQDQQFSVEEDGTLQFTDADLLAGATDIEGDDLSVTGISYEGTDGVLTDNGDGTYSFAPNENFNGDVNFSFDVSDGTDTVSANVDVSVTPVNDPPVAGSTSYTVHEDNSITISDAQLLANSSDLEGDVSIDSVSYSGSDGVLQINGDGTYTFSPNENFNGEVTLDVVVADEEGATDATTAGITVLEVNDPPVAGPTSYTIDEDSVLTFSESQVLLNASDVEGDVELVGISYDGPDGIFTVNDDGTCSFAPNENFNGQVQLDVTIRDEDGAEVDTVINVNVLPINDAPVSGDLAYSVDEDGAITLSQEQLLSQASDIEGDGLTASDLTVDGNATVTANDDGSFTITPDADFNGDIDIQFNITDGTDTIKATADLTVNPVNDLPVPQDQQFSVEEDGTLQFTDADLLAGATDIDGDNLTVDGISYTGSDGVLTDHGDGTYTFAPNENFNGDVSFSFGVSDGTETVPANVDVSVTPVNDPPVAGSTSYTVDEDNAITISDEQLLANSSDVEGAVSIDSVTYSGTDGVFQDNGDGTYTFTPNENFDGNISLDVTVIDQDGATDTTTAGIDVIAVNDAPETSGIQAEVDEDNAITITQEQLLANATDIEGDDLVASNLQTNDPDATIVANDDGSFTITHTENFNGELDFTYNISDGENDVLTTLDLTVNPVNDAPEAGDEIFIQAEEDQTVGVSLREEPALRLDQAPENGIIEANLNDEWVQLEVGQEVPADTEVRFIPNDDALANGTHTSQIGTFDDNASLDDWGTAVDPYTREFVDGDLKVTVQSNDDPLGAWNGKTHIGHGIGDTDRQGLSGDEKLTVTVEGQDINEISFHLDGLGGWFMEESRHFTEVEIRAFNSDGDLIDSMTYHKEDRGSYETDYPLTVNEPVSYFELGTIQGNGTYVVQNMTVSQTCHDEAVFTSIGVDGTEITETVELNIREGDSEIELTADLPNVTIDTEGSTQFASVVITEEQLLAQASDIDSDVLDIQNLELVGDNAEHATLTDNGDGTWTVTPDENFYGEIELGYQVTDGELTDDNIININFEAVNDAPIVSGPIVLSTDEDVGITFSADDLLANASDVEGDALSISDISYSGDNGELVDNGDGTYTFMPNENFNGEVDIDYKVFDGTDEVDTHLDLTVIPVNDVPVPGAPLHTQMLENGTIIIEAKDLLSGATDVDGDILHIENLLLVDQSQGTLTDNGDNTFTFEPTSNFYGEVNLTFDISDGQASAPSTAKIDVEIVNEGPEVSGPVDAVVDEDGSITITQEDLLANATDVDGDNLEAVNLSTNDPNATIVENADGSFTITPSENFFGEIEFTYDVTDAIETVAADLNLTVNPVNDLPDVPDLSFTTEDGEAITITEAELLAQATDIEGDDLSVVNVTSLSDTVQVTDNGDGTYTLTPEQGFFGNVDLTFDVSDGTDVVAANIDLKVEFVNDAPEAAPIVADVDEDGSILVTQEMLLENASDQDGDDLYATALETNDPNASIVDNGDGTFTVTPSQHFNGDIEFTYEVSDGELSVANEMTLTVNPVNDIPIVAPGMYHIEEDGSILFTQEDLLSGAIDIDGDDLTVTSINYSGDEGTVTDNGDGTFSFVPEEHFSGDLQFSFTVSDGTDEVEQDINVHIEAVADAPDLVITDGDGRNVDDQAILVEPGGIVEVNIAAALVDQDLSETLTVTVDGVPEGSVISYDNEGVLNDQDNGITSFNDTEITVTFEGETAGYQNTAGYYKVDEDGNITGVEVVYENASQVGGGDLVPGQDQFSFQISEGESFNLFLIPNGHNFNDFASMQDGQYEFRAADGSPANMDTVDPQLVFVGADGSETVIQSQFGDAVFHGGSSSELNQDGIEHTRTTVNEDGELVYGFEDLYGGGDADYTDFNFTIDVGEVNSQIYSGEVTVGPDGSVTLPTTAIEQELQIQLPEDFNQQLEINVTATATELSNNDSETVSQTIYVNATGAHIEHAPEALPVSAMVEEDGSILITQEDLLANARDLDGDQLTALNLATDDENITITDNGDGTYTLTPDADFNGYITFTFDVSDGDDVVSTNLELLVSPVNDAPEPQDQAFTVGEDGVLTFTDADLLTGATDIEGDDLSVEGVTYTGADGVLTDNGDGTYSFAPNENFNGDVNFTFDVSDGTDTVTANIDVTVTPENDPPVAGSTAYTVHEDNSITISDEQLLANSSDIEGDVLIDSVSYSGNDGVLEINGDGTYTFSPNENFSGEVSLDVVVVDEEGATDSTTAGITVIEVNDPPIAGPTAYTIDEDQVLTFSESQVLLNASDVEGDVELVGISYDGPDGIFSVNGDGTCSFAPNENFNGQVQLDVTIRDEDGAEVDTYITVDVLPINDAPVSGNLAYSVDEDNSITLSQEQLLAQASDVEGDALTASNLVVDGDATVTANDDGSFTITPDANFNGDIDITFDINDGSDTIVATADLTVNPVNDLPQPEDQAFTIGEDGVLTFTDQDLLDGATDIDGDDLSIEGVTYTGADGVLTDNGDGTYSFAPNENFNGDVNFTFDVSDGTDTVTANIDVTVTPENDPPVAGSTSYTVHEDNSITISDEQLLANSSDVEGDVAVDSVSYSGTDGVFQDNGDGTYTFSPNENFNGEVSLDVVVVDEDGATDSTTAGITVLEVNDPPIAGATSYSVNEDEVITISSEQLLANASDVEGEVAIDSVSYSGSDGIFTDNGDGTFSFAPNANFDGDVSLDVVVVDEDGATASTNANIDVLPINDAPVSGNLAYSVDEDNSITLSQEQLLAQASDVEGDALTATNLVVDGDATVTANDDGSFTITPDANFNGDIDITFDINDGSDTIVATADLTVNPVNDLPQPEDQAFTIGEDGVLTFTDQDLLDGATDIDGDDLSVEGVSYTGADGVLTDNGDGTYSFAPNENFNGDVSFTFDVSDGTDTVTANIDVTVTPENDPPVAGSTSYTVHEDNSITISDEQLLANSSDVEGDVAVDSVSYSGTDGVFQDNGDGTYTFSPNENFNGEVSLDVVVVDEDGATDSTTADITVLEVNDPPIAGATSYSVNEDEVITISSEQLLANASDVEGDVAIDSVSYSGSDGIFTDNGDGTFSFAPNENFNGDVSLNVVVVDEDGATASTNASIDVLPINDAPVSGDLAYSVDEDGSITLSQEQLLAQAGDVDGDDLTASNLTVDGNATVVANNDGSFTITPDADFNGDIDLSFDITDGDATIQATADLTVNPVNDLPTVGQPQFVTQEDTSFTFTEEQLLQNAGDIDGDNLTVENVASDSGTLVDNGDGTYTFAPNENFDGNVNVTFDVNDGTVTVPAEANIDVQSVVDMPELSIASDLVIASDNFESGSNGWNANTESSQGFETGDMLGRIGGTGGDEAVSKTYDIPSDVNEVNISFSFYEIDSWDGESFQIFVGGEQLTTLENSAFRTQDGTTTLYDSDGNEVGEVIHGASQREGFSGWNDQAHQINLTVPVEDGELQLGFGSTLNQDVWDESFGIDNIEITVADADYQIIGTEDTPVPLDIDAALTDTDGSENLAILIEDVPEGSSLSAGVDNGDGTWSLQPGELEGLEFIPSADFNGDVTLTVNATSTDVDTGTTATATQDVTIHISPTNDAPEVTGDITAVTAEDNSITLTQEQLLEHAVDIDGDDLSAINLSTNDENATVEMNEDGSFTITPSENFYGDIEFSYDVTDGEEVVAAGLDLTVTPVNDAPEPQDQAFTVGEDGLLTFTDADLLTGATDVEGDNLTVEGVTYTGADGVLTDNGDGTYSFAPNENFNGDVNFTFDVSDGTDTTSANIDVSVTPENDPPVAGSTSYTVHEDNSITISDEQLLANSSDIEGDVDISSVTYSGNDGVFQDNGDGTYTFSPNENFNGEVSLDVVVVDEEGATDSTTAGITVLEVNDPPIAGATSYSVNEDEVIIFTEEQLLAQSSDVEGDVSLESVSYSGSDGILTANDDGTYSFAPNENFNGGVSLDVVVADEDGATATTNANIDVLPVNDAPVSGDLAYSVDEDGSITLSQEQLLAQAGDVDSDNLEAVNLTAVANATVVENQDGSFTITPDANFNGDIDLSFDLIDNDGASVEVGVDLTVNPINDAPQSTPVNIAGTEDTTILITQDMLLANATDIDNTYDELSAVDLVIDEQYGDLLDNGDGTWSFTPAENFNGDVPMSFGVSDGDLVTPVEGNLNIEAVNDAPEAPTIQMQGEEDVVMVIDPAYIADQVTDLDGDEISVESITVRAPANATLTQQPDGMYHLVTTQDFNGLVELGYTATDGEEVVEGSLNVDVIPVNDAPFNVGNAFMATDEDGAFTFDAGDLMNLFGDIDTENLVVSRIITAEGEDGGEVTDNGDGTWTFTPTGDFAGVSDLQVVVSDGEFETVLDVPVFVRPVADGAVITTDHDGPLVFGEDETGHLGLNVGLIDDSETLSNLVMTGFPVGFEVTDGVNTITITEPGQYIDLNEWDISDLQMTPPADFNGEFFVTVTATTVDYGDEPEEFEDGIDSGDFETLAGEPVILTADDLIGLAENVDADAGDEVKFVHLADRSQGEIVDNGDGTWTFNPAPGFTGEADIAYVIDKDGVLHDEQTGVVVKEDAPQDNVSPEIDSISTTEMAADGTLSFTNDDMLSTLSDAEGDSLSIESVSLMEGQGVIEADNQGNYQFTPAEGYTGDVQVGFIATDGENRIESFFNVDIQGEGETTTSEGYALADDGSLTLTEAQLIDELGISPSAEVLDVADANDAGFFAKSGDEEWTYWPNDDFDGNLAMDVQVNDNGEVSTQNLSIQVADDSAQSDEPQIQTAQASSEQQVGEAQQPEEQAANGADSEEESAADVTAAPGDTISISVPDEVSGNESVDYAEMSGLPDGASVSNALDNGDGSFTLSGNLNQPVSVDLPEGYEGTSEIQFQGYDELGSAVEGASGTVEVEVDDQYTMQGSAQDQQPDMAGMESGGSDWTSAGSQDQGVDFTDDSGSFDSDTQTGTDQGNDFDQSSM
ncbi:tandem-95 repeat protein [Vibrio sp. 1075]|uniref:tandem-95 repeat protein n=1 Tax=Vibrio sp. 1075 TaxID=3074543 RepID=UPI0029650C27|nr:tandem-95 repeat protein [Vibrio sp. 1075]MDW2309913.1 tandem-95 repeat protein [Vibrio sp. 1075]